MGVIASGPMFSARRGIIILAAAGLTLGLSQTPSVLLGDAVASEPTIILVSRKRLLNETTHAKALLEAEIELTSELQRRVDEIKASLTAEETELTQLRQTLGRQAFDARVSQFESDVRRQRRQAQQYAATLQNAFRAERLKLIQALDPLLEEVRAEYGASVILNIDQVLVSDSSLDVTDEVIARFNATVTMPTVPNLDALIPEPAPAPDAAPSSE